MGTGERGDVYVAATVSFAVCVSCSGGLLAAIITVYWGTDCPKGVMTTSPMEARNDADRTDVCIRSGSLWLP